ncbi:agamous-like MADS-box protein AGL61 [Papaver somniferum]|uniref:agamous-like MADS-box protein AGL61 n=1 Tax=Papaver somniferum TaxID=3469 RepID=UPI000E6F60A3|nr:agamous-like MADS-box protein AGL61 [Papaver somniferum]
MDKPKAKKTHGRKKIELKRIEKEVARQTTFTKRKEGIFKKACQLNTLCAAETAVVLFSPSGAPFSFGEPSVQSVVDRFLADGRSLREESLIKEELDARNDKIDTQYNTSLKRQEDAQVRGKELAEAKKADGDLFGWDVPIKEMNLEQLESLKFELGNLQIIEEPVDATAASSSANPLFLSRGSSSSNVSINPPPPNDPQGYHF